MDKTIGSAGLDQRMLTETLLDQIPGIPTAAAKALSSAYQVQNFEAGETIVREGEASTGIFLLIDGTVEAFVSKSTKQVSLHQIAAPAVLGITAAMLTQPSAVSLVSVTQLHIAFIPRREFLQVLRQFPEAGLAFSQVIANELAHTYSKLSQLRIPRCQPLLDAGENWEARKMTRNIEPSKTSN